MSIEDAHNLLKEWVPNERLRLHMKQVAANMKAWAIEKENADEQTALKWELAGLLHDADWEKYPDEHPNKAITELLASYPKELKAAIATHAPERTGKLI